MARGNGDFGRNSETHYAVTPLSIRLEALQPPSLSSPPALPVFLDGKILYHEKVNIP